MIYSFGTLIAAIVCGIALGVAMLVVQDKMKKKKDM